jgi:hypothetical protein
MVESIERDLLDCFAGPVAEAVYRHSKSDKFIKGSGWGDRRRGHELISLLPARKLLDAESLAIARASCLVRRYWPAVTAVADLLQECGTVDGEAITALLCEVTGESPTRLGNDLTTLDTQRNKRWTATHAKLPFSSKARQSPDRTDGNGPSAQS